jgi:hypothetical protein
MWYHQFRHLIKYNPYGQSLTAQLKLLLVYLDHHGSTFIVSTFSMFQRIQGIRTPTSVIPPSRPYNPVDTMR